MLLSCIVCDYQPTHALPETEVEWKNQPYKATCFTTRGHYGSTFIDVFEGIMLEITICDECLERAKIKKQILKCDSTENNVWTFYE